MSRLGELADILARDLGLQDGIEYAERVALMASFANKPMSEKYVEAAAQLRALQTEYRAACMGACQA